MRHRAALPLLRVARTPQPSLVAAAASATASVSTDSDSIINKEQQYALCLLGCYCLSICCYAAFIGIAVEVATARRAAVRRAAAAALPAAVAVSAAAAADVTAVASGAKQMKASYRRSISQWLQHAVLPGLVVPLVVESVAFCKSSSGCSSSRHTQLNSSTGGPDDRDNAVMPEGSAGTGSSSNIGSPSSQNTRENPFACNPSLLLAAPLATSLAELLRYLRQEQMQLQTE